MIKKNILILEDEPVVALDYQLFLEKNGFETTISYSADKAIEKIKNKIPDLALLDIKVKGGTSGLEVGKFLKKLNIPFIFISAFSDPLNYTKAVDLKPAHIFFKPVNCFAVCSIIQEILLETTTF